MSGTTEFDTGAVRSSDAGHLDFASLPLIGLIGVARTATEGGTKYGRYNYMLGMPAHDLLNHSVRHVVLWLLGDRSEPHLEHAAWGLLAAIQSHALDPALSAPHLLGPGATVSPEVKAHLEANAATLAEKRRAGRFDGIGEWSLRDVPEVARLLGQREALFAQRASAASQFAANAEAMLAVSRREAQTIPLDDRAGLGVFPAATVDDDGFLVLPGRRANLDDVPSVKG